ncbi:MAG: M23 family metallopeptidase [Helicobacter sp.]|nr:M23 family metallopeptidase [Helicobacter sp.]
MKTLKTIIVLIIIVAIGYWVKNSGFFETTKPSIALQSEGKNLDIKQDGFWNPNKNMELEIKDDSGIKSYHIIAQTQDGEVLIDHQENITKRPKIVKIPLPKPNLELEDGVKISYQIQVRDWSNSHFFSGNQTNITYNLTIDTKAPIVRMIANSYRIVYGGSALLIFKINDMSVKNISISNGTDNFKAFPFMKDGYYAVLIAWPIKNKAFNGTISVTDQANNLKKVGIPVVKNPNIYYRNADLRLSDNFINTKPDMLINAIGERTKFDGPVEKFKYLNEDIRERDENIIRRTAQMIDFSMIEKPLSFAPFFPLKRSQNVGSFGDHRTYIYKDKKISKSVHLGLDMANFKHAPIISSNPGKVTFADTLGIYGNSVIIDHGLGLSTLYSHASKFEFDKSGIVKAGDEIAKTGQTGWAFGDHLHLGILVQGHEVRVKEWMDPKWIKNNINDVFTKAAKIINEDS